MIAQEKNIPTLFESNSFQPIQAFTDAGSPDVPCDFCDGTPEQTSFFDISQPLGLGNVALKPALGMLVPGYFITVTKEHVTSFAQLDHEQLTEADNAMAQVETHVGSLFGDYFRFEHGSDSAAQCSVGAGACVDHAHQHLVPAPEVAEYMLDKKHPDHAALRWQEVDAFEDLEELRGRPYMYLGFDNAHYVSLEPGVRSQWMRRQITHVYDLPVWDWALYNGAQELRTTLQKIGCAIPDYVAWDGDCVSVSNMPLPSPLRVGR